MLTDDDIEIAMHGKPLPMDYDELKQYAREIERAVLEKAMPIPKQEPDIERLGDQLANAEIAIQSLLEQKPAYRMGYQYDEGNEDPDLGGDLVLHQLDGKDYPVGTLFYAYSVPAQGADCVGVAHKTIDGQIIMPEPQAIGYESLTKWKLLSASPKPK